METLKRIKTHAPKEPKQKKEVKNYFYYKQKRDAWHAKKQGGAKRQESFNAVNHLHQTLGNKKVTELHRSGKLMAMLKMSTPGDRYEREADQVASQVMNTNPGTIHENSKTKVAPKVDMTKVHRKKGNTTESQIKNLSGGEKLDGGTKKFFQSRFDGLDLNKVNIHKGRKAQKMANSINARAFTYGNNIVFNKGEYKPGTMQGKKLLAHELTHVAQQTGGSKKMVKPKLKEGAKPKNALTVTNKDRNNSVKSFTGRFKANQTAKADINKANQTKSPAPPVKVSNTQGKVVQGWWGKKDDKEKDKEEEEEDKKPKGIGGFAWWAFKGLLGLLGIDVDQFVGILNKAADALGAIIKDPKGFFGNLGKAVKGGINNFVKNFKKHLLNGIAGWLFGNLGDAGLEMPSSFDFKGILSIVLQVVGLTYNNIRGQIIKGLGKGGEEMMSHAEGLFDVLKTAVTEGPMALWEQLKEYIGDLKDQFFGMIIDWVKSTVIQQGVMFLISMLNPAGALVQAVRAIIKVVTFFMERWQQIQDFASSVVDSVSLIAKGDTTAAQNGVENSLAKAMPITISFIAKLVGLGGISKHIKKVIKKIQKPINNAIKKVTGKFAKKIKDLPIFKKGKEALDKGKKAVESGKKKINDVKESAEKKVSDTANKMKDNVEKGRADRQNKQTEEAKEKGRKGKDAQNKDKNGLTEDDKKKHKQYADQIVQKLQADKGNNSKDFKEFHASKVKLAKDLETSYQKKLKKGINIDIKIKPLAQDKKDNDVDFDIKIAPNTTQVKDKVKCDSLAPDVDSIEEMPEVIIDFVSKDKTKHKVTFKEVSNLGELKIDRFDFARARTLLTAKAKEFNELKKTQKELYEQNIDTFISEVQDANERLNKISEKIVVVNNFKKQLVELSSKPEQKEKLKKVRDDFFEQAGKLKAMIMKLSKQLSYVMVEASGVGEFEKVQYPGWGGEVPANTVEVKYLNTKNGFQKGESAKGDIHGWKLLQDEKLTNGQGGTYVRMHIVSEQLGGKAKPGNLAAAPQEVNRAFYNSLEKQAIQAITSGGMIWFRVNLSYQSVKAPDDKNYKFIDSISAEFGGYNYEDKKWKPDSAPAKTFNWAGIKAPDFTPQTVNINSEQDASITYKGLKVSKTFAEKFINWRDSNKLSWASYTDLIIDLKKFDEKNPDAEVKLGDASRYIENIKYSNRKGYINF